MHIKKILFKLIITCLVLESIYLFAVPAVLNYYAQTDHIKNILAEKTNANFNYNNAKFKTHFIPALSINVGKFEISDKNDNIPFLNIKNGNVKIRIIPLLTKTISIENLYADDATINLVKDENNIFNLQGFG